MIINSILLNRIKKLSETEPNNLTRRCAKFSEELGELSAACLAVDDPDGKNYKDLGPQHVKEESVDCLLMAFSTFFDPTIGGTIEELVQLLSKKCDKWENTSHKGVGLNYQTLKELNESVKSNSPEPFTTKHIIDRTYIDKQAAEFQPMCSASEWYDIYFSGISYKQMTEYLASCGFIDIYPSPPRTSIPVLMINPTRRLHKFYYIDLHDFEVNDYSHIITAGTINDLSNFINVAINKVN